MLRLHHGATPTERSSVEWSGRCVQSHGRRSRDPLVPAEPKIEAVLTAWAVHGPVAAATQNQAMTALVCLDTRVLNQTPGGRIDAGRAAKKINGPAVMTRAAVAAVCSRMDGAAPPVAKRLYGSGVRLMGAVRLRGQDSAVQLTPRTVRAGQGDKDRCTTCPATLTPWLQTHLAGVKTWHPQD